MTTTIRTICPVDGEVDLTADMIKITPDKDAYVFNCTGGCGRLVSKQSDDKIINLLTSAGVGVVEAPEPVYSPEPLPKDLKPFGLDDMIDFHQNMDEELDKLLGKGDIE